MGGWGADASRWGRLIAHSILGRDAPASEVGDITDDDEVPDRAIPLIEPNLASSEAAWPPEWPPGGVGREGWLRVVVGRGRVSGVGGTTE